MNIKTKETLKKFSTDDLILLIESLFATVEYLDNKIQKAIEYIKRNCLEFNIKYACQGLNNDKVDVLLDILRGEENED